MLVMHVISWQHLFLLIYSNHSEGLELLAKELKLEFFAKHHLYNTIDFAKQVFCDNESKFVAPIFQAAASSKEGLNH